jgi:hypothetical protein
MKIMPISPNSVHTVAFKIFCACIRVWGGGMKGERRWKKVEDKGKSPSA